MALPTRTEQLDDFYTSTWNNRSKTVVDNIFTATPLWKFMKGQNAIKYDGSGGRFLEVPLSYAKNETVASLGKGDTVSLNDTKFLTTAQYQWKYVAGNLTRYFTDDQQNKGKQAQLNLANAKIDNLKNSLSDKFEEFMFGDGTGNGSKDPNGLRTFIVSSPSSGTVGNIDASAHSWWRNKQKTATGAASVYLLSDMRNLFNNCATGQGVDMPNVIFTDQTSYELYEDEVQELKVINDASSGDPMMKTVTFKGIPIYWSSQAPSAKMYFLNTKYIAVTIDPDVNFMMTEWKTVANTLDRYAQIVVKIETTCSRRASQGVLESIAA